MEEKESQASPAETIKAQAALNYNNYNNFCQMKIDAFPGALTKQKTGYAWAYVLTAEQREWLCKWFPEEENSRLMKASGMSHSTLHRFARELHLTKSKAGMKRIKRRQVSNITVDEDCYGYDEDLKKQELLEHIHADINGEAWLLVWDCFGHEFTTDMKENQK